MIRRVKNFAHAILASAAERVYGRPSKKISTIGVTGTDGKTTTAALIFHILKTAGFNAAVISTVGAQIGDQEFDTGLHTTTPSPFFIQKYIKRAVDAGCDYLVLEVTSHALDQNRIKGIDFKIGVLTNITHDHLDYHKSHQKYVDAKSKLFTKSEISVLNLDDESYEVVRKRCSGKTYSYSLHKKANFNLKNIGIKFPGEFEFNFENFLAAASVAKILGIPEEKIALALLSFKFPSGRQEIVYEEDFQVVIDFAHTPNSFKRILPVLKKSTYGRLIHVFGAAGQRDASKRPMMGEIASQYADIIILTAEDPRSESISHINEQIMIGIKGFQEYDPNLYEGQNKKKILFQIPDRKDAIDFALEIAKEGDTVLLTGKGHEKSMNLGQGEVPWSEHDAVERSLRAA